MCFFDRKRDELLAAIYGKRFVELKKIYSELKNRIENNFLSEADQKALNQIQRAVKKFLNIIPEDFRIKDIYEEIRKTCANIVKEQVKNVKYIKYETWRKRLGLSEQQYSIMLKTVSTLQITVGCSNYCRRCNEWALPGIRAHFDFNAVKKITKDLFNAGNFEFIYYGASDPLDWRCEDKNIIDILKFAKVCGKGFEYGILTKIPKGSESIAEMLLQMGADIAVSVTGNNRSKIKRIEKSAKKEFEIQHDSDQLEIQAGLAEDFESIKSSITDNYGTEITPCGAFLIIPTFTSALNPTGQCRVQVTSSNDFFIKKKVGRDALPVEYFKPLRAIDADGKEFTLNHLLDAQIENILLDYGNKDVYPPGMMNMAEYFKTFEPDTVLQRKRLFLSVLKRLEKEVLQQKSSRKKDFPTRRTLFRRKVRAYIKSCRIEDVIKYKRYAFSFLLESIADYLTKHPAKREIVLFLRKDDKEKFQTYFKKNIFEIDSIFENFDNKTFELFEFLIFLLLENPKNDPIDKFIKKYPAKYDQETDMFSSLA